MNSVQAGYREARPPTCPTFVYVVTTSAVRPVNLLCRVPHQPTFFYPGFASFTAPALFPINPLCPGFALCPFQFH